MGIIGMISKTIFRGLLSKAISTGNEFRKNTKEKMEQISELIRGRALVSDIVRKSEKNIKYSRKLQSI